MGAILVEASGDVHEALATNVVQLTGNRASPATRVWHDDALLGCREAASGNAASRALLFADPPYEATFSDQQNFALLQEMAEVWPNSTVAIWYPILDEARAARMYRRIQEMDLEKILVAEFGVERSDAKQSMVRSGVLMLRPPEGLATVLADTLPALERLLA